MNPTLHGKYNTNSSARSTQLLSRLVRILFKDYLQYFHFPTAPIKATDCPHKTKQAIAIYLCTFAQAISATGIFLLTSPANVPSFAFQPD